MRRGALAMVLALGCWGLAGEAAAQTRQLRIRVTPTGAHLGDPIVLEVDVDHDEDARVSVPRGLKLAPFEVMRRRTRTSDLPDGRVRETFRFELLCFELGEHVIPPFEIRLIEPSGEVKRLRTDPGRVTIAGRLEGVAEAQPKPNHGPVPVLEPRTWPLWVGLTALAALVLAAVVAWLVRRHAARPVVVAAPPPRPPWEIALEKLAAIRAKGAPPEGAHKEYYDAVSDVVREYLGAIGGFPALDLTTEELLAAVRQRPPPVVSMGEIAGFLGECDLVKFAKAPATADQTLALLDAAAGIVHRTRTGLEPARPAVQEAA